MTVRSRPGLRRGLPRVAGGERWPSEGQVIATLASPSSVDHVVEDPVEAPAARVASAPQIVSDASPRASAQRTRPLRRGLPRGRGEDAWPPATAASAANSAGPADADAYVDVERRQSSAPDASEAAAPMTATGSPIGSALPLARTAWRGPGGTRPELAPIPPRRIGPYTRVQWAGMGLVGAVVALFVVAMAVALTRAVLSTPWGLHFLSSYPGEYHLPDGAPVGFPAWLGWQHYLNAFFMVLIIRSGLQIRREKRPQLSWSPRGNPKRKISLTIWFHQSLDILWLVNGLVFVVLLFVTGQWLRIVPSSWEVFPNALSAALQYLSLDWPTENGWVNYNSLQQLSYFTVVFIAAPVAALTGVRMSGVWPKNAPTISRLYPIEWARAIHFPTMLFFLVFIFFHVVLVFATGALRNLNHMYAAQGSVDPQLYSDNWSGFLIFAASILVIAAAWVAARPLVLAPIARLFGTVSR